jgi:hypothetical protein
MLGAVVAATAGTFRGTGNGEATELVGRALVGSFVILAAVTLYE